MPDLLLAACSGASPDAAAELRGGQVALYRVSPETATARRLSATATVPSPSFLVWSERSSILYVASEIAEGDGRVTALSIEGEAFVPGNRAGTGGNAAVHLCLDRTSRYLFAANYQGDGNTNPVSVAVFPLGEDGAVGAMTGSAAHEGHGSDAARQSRPHCHSVMISPDNRLLAAADLGTDSLYLYRFDSAGGGISLAEQLRTPPGTGPRHSVFHPSKPLLYLTGELDSSLLTVSVDSLAGKASVVDRVDATATESGSRNYPSGIAISPDGHYVLVANRGADRISVFWIDPESGRPRLRSEMPCGGRFPRAIRFDPSARYLAVANQHSGDVSVFGWDFARGVLSDRPLATFSIPTPLDMVFLG